MCGRESVCEGENKAALRSVSRHLVVVVSACLDHMHHAPLPGLTKAACCSLSAASTWSEAWRKDLPHQSR